MIDILLATYNSEKFLREQLDSILEQDCSDFCVVIRDANSTDATVSIIEEYQRKYPDKFKFVGSAKANAVENFSELLKLSTAPLVMFADHDDVWLPNKISLTLAKYQELEKQYGDNTPIMVYADSYIVDSQLNIVADSMIKFQNLNLNLKLSNLLVQNTPSGNTMLINRALVDLALPISPKAVMHDHWLSLVAVCWGKFGFVNQPLLKYRQHGANVYGASSYSLLGLIRKLSQGVGKIRARFYQNVSQAQDFLEGYREQLSPQDLAIVSAFASFDKVGFFYKRYLILKYAIWKNGILRNLGMLLLI